MANPNSPAGLQLTQAYGQADYRASLDVFYVKASVTNAIFVGDPVIKVTNSADVNGINEAILATAGTSNRITGVVCGFLGTGNATLGQPAGASFFGLSGTPGPAYKPANNSTPYYMLVCTDPQAQYVIQSNDSGGNLAVGSVGRNANLASGNGSIYTGWSGWTLAANTVGTASGNQLTITGFLPEVDNVPGNANAKVLVRINQNTEVNASTGI